MSYAMNDDPQTPGRPSWTLGDRLRKSREEAGLTQTQMGALLREFNDDKPYSHSTVAAWERDKNPPRHFAAILLRWAAITDVDPAWLLEGAGFPLPRELTLTTSPIGQLSLDDILDRGPAQLSLVR